MPYRRETRQVQGFRPSVPGRVPVLVEGHVGTREGIDLRAGQVSWAEGLAKE